MTFVPRDAFAQSTLSSLVPCSSIAGINLDLWKDEPTIKTADDEHLSTTISKSDDEHLSTTSTIKLNV
jgi:hypothetical protein